MTTPFTIEVYFDLICPWCLIGKRHLASALDLLRQSNPEISPRIVWMPYPLLPDTPLEGLPYQEFYERRLGGPAAVVARRAQVQAAAQSAGLKFAFDAIRVMPNTLSAHRLIEWARRNGDDKRLETLIDTLFTAYFMDGKDIGDSSVLLDIATACGYAADAQAIDGASRDIHHPEHVPGVPFFIFDGRIALSGANPPDVLYSAMQQAIK